MLPVVTTSWWERCTPHGARVLFYLAKRPARVDSAQVHLDDVAAEVTEFLADELAGSNIVAFRNYENRHAGKIESASSYGSEPSVRASMPVGICRLLARALSASSCSHTLIDWNSGSEVFEVG